MSEVSLLMQDVACGNVQSVLRRTERAQDLLLAETKEYLHHAIVSPDDECPLTYSEAALLLWKLERGCGTIPSSLLLTNVLVPLTERKRSHR